MTVWPSSLFAGHVDLLDASGIPPDVAAERGYVSVDTKVRLEKLGFGSAQRSVPGLLIPIHGVGGEVVLHQYRPDLPRERDRKVVKYETPTRARMALDVPPRIREHLDDPNWPLFITEGARKADAAAALGLCCIGLLGVWNWRGTNEKGGKTALPDWESIALNGRMVYIAYDSDVTVKPEVRDALVRLKAFLELRKARVQVIYLPTSEGGAKTGLDDYLAAGHGVDDLLALARPDLPAPVKQEQPPKAISYQGPPIVLAAALDDLAAFIRRYVVMTPEQADTLALHVAHTHVIRYFETTPYIHVKSAEMRSGKSTTLKLYLELAARPRSSLNISDAAVYRLVDSYPEAEPPTFVMDEVDRVFYASKGGEQSRQELAGLINGGYQRGPLGQATRMVGEGANQQVTDFRTFSPKVMAGIRDLPGTIGDRAIPITLKRKAPGETVERFRIRRVRAEATPIRELLEALAAAEGLDALVTAEPVMPAGLHDREEDLWEPLLAIADLAGGDWPERARGAAVWIGHGAAVGDDVGSSGIQLLADIRTVFTEKSVDRMPTMELIEALGEIEESPWATWHRGNPISKQTVAVLLKPYGIKPKVVRVAEKTPRGYERASFEDAWERYIPPDPPPGTFQGATPATAGRNPRGYAEPAGAPGCNTDEDVAPCQQAANPHGYADVASVADQNRLETAAGDAAPLIDATAELQLEAIGLSNAIIDRLMMRGRWDVLAGRNGCPATEQAWHSYCADAIGQARPDRLEQALRDLASVAIVRPDLVEPARAHLPPSPSMSGPSR